MPTALVFRRTQLRFRTAGTAIEGEESMPLLTHPGRRTLRFSPLYFSCSGLKWRPTLWWESQNCCVFRLVTVGRRRHSSFGDTHGLHTGNGEFARVKAPRITDFDTFLDGQTLKGVPTSL